jgi:hypothetical protein
VIVSDCIVIASDCIISVLETHLQVTLQLWGLLVGQFNAGGREEQQHGGHGG